MVLVFESTKTMPNSWQRFFCFIQSVIKTLFAVTKVRVPRKMIRTPNFKHQIPEK